MSQNTSNPDGGDAPRPGMLTRILQRMLPGKARPPQAASSVSKDKSGRNEMDYVVLGAGPAGVTAAETLRSIDKTARITIINGEKEPQPYSRMAIPYYIYGKIEEGGTYLRQTEDHYGKMGIEYRVGRCGGIEAQCGLRAGSR